MIRNSSKAIVDWLSDGARTAPEPEQVLAELCDQLIAAGIPLWRVAVFVHTLHPDIVGRRFLWRSGAGVQTSRSPFEVVDTEGFQKSPLAHISRYGVAIRRRLVDGISDFPILHELRADGVTDYLASPLIFTNGEINVATWTTREPGGFTNEQIEGIESVIAPLARVTEVRELRRTAIGLLDTYVGNQAGARILSGRIRRGDADLIHAVIWLSDMRGFTALADRLPPGVLLNVLNGYFDSQVPAILKHGGEVLKFMGDGLFAIFPVAATEVEARETCNRALLAAREARVSVAKMSATHGSESVDNIHFGLALHVGEVLYGNIGSGNRLDFTCIGPAVNLAARIEKLASTLKRTILCSEEFASLCGRGLRPVGDFTVPGFAATQRVFGLEDESVQPTRRASS